MLQLLTLPVWIFVSFTDLRSRRAPNFAWAILLGIGVLSISLGETPLIAVLLGIVVVYPVSYYLYTRTLIGGADAKAMFVLPLLYPDLLGVILLLTALFSYAYTSIQEERTIPMLVPITASIFFALGVS